MTRESQIQLKLSNTKAGVPLMTGDLGYDEYAGTLSPLGYVNLDALNQAPAGTFRYVRIHNIFTSKEGDGRGARDAGGDPVRIKPDGSHYYDWTIIDMVCQAILDAGCTPFLELGFTPTPWSNMEEIMAVPIEDYPLELQYKLSRKKKGHPGAYPPKDKSLWGDLVYSFAIHVQEKFGKEASSWPCELWNEPDIGYFKGTAEDYSALWDVTYDACKKAGMKIVGGPGVAHFSGLMKKFLEHCVKVNRHPDFVSYHVKGGNAGTMVANMYQMYNYMLQGREQIPEELKDKPIWITEFDPIVGCENGIPNGPKWAFHNKSYYASWLGKACYMIAILQQSIFIYENKQDPDIEPLSVAAIFNDGHHITAECAPFYGARNLTTPIWIESDTEKTHDPLKELKENIDLEKEQPAFAAMLKDLDFREYRPDEPDKYVLKALPKPIFRAFEYTRLLKGKHLPFFDKENEVYGILSHDGGFINLCINVQDDELENEEPVDCVVNIDLKGSGAKTPEVVLSARIDKTSCNPFETWKEMDEPYDLTRVQAKILQDSTIPKPANITDLQASKDEISFKISMLGHSFNFLRFRV
ncbi:MAG: glycosyl hydrolase [Candidatus Hodarchaeota archaeon]